MEVERVDPVSVAAVAASVLREAWDPPVLHYTTEYLRWQLTLPGPPALGVLARHEGEPAAFCGCSARRLRFRGVTYAAYNLSFVAVRPKFRGGGAAGRVYQELFAAMTEAGLPALVFTEENAPASRHLLARACERAGWTLKKLATCQNYGFLARSKAAPIGAEAEEAARLEDALGAMAACDDAATIWAAPDRAMLEHYLRDPRTRRLYVVRERGEVVGAGMVFLNEVMTSQGLERVTTIEDVFFPEPTPDRVASLFRAAAGAFAGEATVRAVGAPNLGRLDPALLKAAGIRPSGAVYDAWVTHRGPHPMLEAEATNAEVV